MLRRRGGAIHIDWEGWVEPTVGGVKILAATAVGSTQGTSTKGKLRALKKAGSGVKAVGIKGGGHGSRGLSGLDRGLLVRSQSPQGFFRQDELLRLLLHGFRAPKRGDNRD